MQQDLMPLSLPKPPNFTNKKRDITLEWVESIVHSLLNSSWHDILVGTTWSSWRSEDYASLDELELLVYANPDIHPDDIGHFEETIRRFSDQACNIIFERKNKDSPDVFEWVNWKTLEKPVFFSNKIYWFFTNSLIGGWL